MKEFVIYVDKTSPSSTLVYDRHCHNQYEIIFISNGCININVEGQQYLLNLNTAILIEPFKYHVIINNQNEYHRLIINFPQSLIPSALKDLFDQNFHTCSILTNKDIVKLFKNIIELYSDNNNLIYYELFRSYIIQIIYFQATQNSQENDNPFFVMGNSHPVIRQALAYIEHNINKNISLKMLTSELLISQSSLCHIFKSEMQISLKQYILYKKINYAKTLISNGEAPTNVAVNCGWQNYASFYKIFCRITGHRPSYFSQKKYK